MADTILVVGAAGMQGGGVAPNLLKQGMFNARSMIPPAFAELCAAARVLSA